MKLCKSILTRMSTFFVHHPSFTRSMSRDGKLFADTKGLYSPTMNTGEITRIDSVLGLNIGLTSIAWARIEVKENDLTHLDYQMFPVNVNKMDPNDIYFFVLKTLESLPKADKFVIEAIRKQMNVAGGQLHMSLQATRLQIISTLVTVLYEQLRKDNDDKIHPVIFLKHRIAGKLFDLLIGSELVACKQTVMDLLTDEFEGPPNPNTLYYNVKTSEPLLTRYKKAPDVGKELMGRAFLETLACTELIIHKNPDSLQKLQGRTRFEVSE